MIQRTSPKISVSIVNCKLVSSIKSTMNTKSFKKTNKNTKKIKKYKKIQKKSKNNPKISIQKKLKKIRKLQKMMMRKKKIRKMVLHCSTNKKNYKNIKTHKKYKNVKKIQKKYKRKNTNMKVISFCIEKALNLSPISILCLSLMNCTLIPLGGMPEKNQTMNNVNVNLASKNNLNMKCDYLMGRRMNIFCLEGYENLINRKMFMKMEKEKSTHNLWYVAGKLKNRLQRSKNGNRSESFKIAHWNGGSKFWRNKISELEDLLSDIKPDLCFISEANLMEETEIYDRHLEGHRIILPKTMTTLKHSRIVLIVRDGLQIEVLEHLMEDDIAAIWVRVGENKRNSIIVGGIYREHQILGRNRNDVTSQEILQEQEQRWEKVIRKWKVAAKMGSCVILGDLNLDFLRWNDPHFCQKNMIELVQNEIEPKGFSQLITECTRSWADQPDSLLDHIWVNCPEKIVSHGNIVRAYSDHNIIHLNISTKNLRTGGQNVRKRSWRNYDKTRCLDKFKRTDWNEVLNEVNVDIANSLLENKILEILDSEAPVKTFQTRTRYNKYLTEQTKDLMELRNEQRELARRTQDMEDWSTFRKTRNKCTNEQRKDKNNYLNLIYKKIEEDKDSKNLFSMSRKLLGWNKNLFPTMFNFEGKMIRKQKELANCQVNYYRDKVQKIKNSINKGNKDPLYYLRTAYMKWKPVVPVKTFHLKQVSVQDVRKLLDNLKSSLSHGHDGIDAVTVKAAAAVLAPPIAHVVNLSLGTLRFPAKWKLGRVIPLLKSTDADSHSPAGYRPVTQLSIISKIAEKCVQSQLLTHLEESGQLSQDHHAYRQYLSTTTALTQVTDEIMDAIDENKIASTMGIDQSAAFDCVEHALLIKKLEFYHLGEDVKEWITSYLSHRSMYVSIGSDKSDIVAVGHGVPQGSVLGPLLFLIYTNDLPMAINDDICNNIAHEDTGRLFGSHCEECGMMPLYADDALYISVSKSRMKNQLNIERTFTKITEYLNMNGLQINATKTTLTEFMCHQKRAKTRGIPPELTVEESVNGDIKDKHILDKPVCRTLGANLRNDMTWEAHLLTGKRAVIPAIRRQLGALHKIGGHMSQLGRLQLTNALIISKLAYLITLWGNTNGTMVEKAQRAQNLAARYVTGMKKTTKIRTLLEQCNWLSIAEMTKYYSAVQIWKTLVLNKPIYLREKLQLEEQDNLSTNIPRLKITGTAFRCQATTIWNELPAQLKTEVSIKIFKRGLRLWILERRTSCEDQEPD